MKKQLFFLTLLLPVISLSLLWHGFSGAVEARPQMVQAKLQLIDVGGTITTDTTWTVANAGHGGLFGCAGAFRGGGNGR